ncbi:MAG: hypothetical protein HYR48_05555 [Gemmatimonadetes bacterium]|nr:hypothetical protein [Gemmatimonadota bacterium]
MPAKRRWLALVATLVLSAGVFGTDFGVSESAELDPAQIAVFPFEQEASSAPALLSGDESELLLSGALSRWRGVKLVSALRVNDALARHGAGGVLTESEVVSIAKDLGVGRVAWGSVRKAGDSMLVRAVLLDAAHGGRALEEHAVLLGPDLEDLGPKFAELADALLLGDVGPATESAAAPATASLDAWRAYEQGHRSLATWDLAGAERAFRVAVAGDPDFAPAWLWLTQVVAWAGDTAGELREVAGRAYALRQELPQRDRLAAEAAQALAQDRHPQACRIYRSLIASDSLDFASWYGLGMCHSQDKVVLRDPRGRWYFRGSTHAALNAYRRALEILPSSHLAFRGRALRRLARLFYVDDILIRPGYAIEAADTLRFLGRPSMEADTLVIVPLPIGDVVGGRSSAWPSSRRAAVARNRRILTEITAGWVRAFPASADALEARGRALEAAVVARGATLDSALAMVRLAHRLSANTEQQVDLTAAEARLLLKRGDFAAAARVADSVLNAVRAPSPRSAAQLAWMATLIGRADRAADLASRAAREYTPYASDGRPVEVALAPRAAALRLLAYASLGLADSARALMARVDRLVQEWAPRAAQPEVRSSLLDVPATLAFPELGLTAVHRPSAGGLVLIDQQWAVARDRARAHARIEADIARARQAGIGANFETLDWVFGTAHLLLILGDTAAAVRSLDRLREPIRVIPLGALSGELQTDVPQAASLVRALVLRAQIAARAGDAATARRSAEAALALWSGADAALQPVVQQIRALVLRGT